MKTLRIKRIYEPREAGDGMRVLVDGLWPRGVTKQKADLDLWLKGIAPSRELCTWYGHCPERWEEFKHRYFGELDEKPGEVAQLAEALRGGSITLLFAARDETHSNAAALAEYLAERPTLHPKKRESR